VINDSFVKKLWLGLLPILQGLPRRKIASGSLRNMLVIDLSIVHDGLSESRDGWNRV